LNTEIKSEEEEDDIRESLLKPVKISSPKIDVSLLPEVVFTGRNIDIKTH
jgi:hypothetical protein